MSRHRRWLIPLCIFLLCLTVYSVIQAWFVERNRGPYGVVTFITDGDEVNYLVLTESIISDHDLSPLNNYFNHSYKRRGYYQVHIGFPYRWDTTNLLMVPGPDGRMVLMHLPFLPLLLVPGFALFGYAGAAGTMILMMSLAAVLVFLVIRRICREGTAVAATLSFFLTYPVITYSRLVYDVTAAVFLLSLALWASLRLRESGRWWYALAAALPAACLVQLHVKYSLVVLALLFLLWACSADRRRDLLVWLAPVALSFVGLLALTRYLYGPNVLHGLTVSSGGGGFFGVTPFWGVFGLYLDRAWGLFIFAPLYFAFLPGVPLPRGRKDLSEWWVFIPLCIVLHTLTVGMFGKWSGDVSPVPRQLIPIMPLLVICAALFFDRCRSKVMKAGIGILLAFQTVLTVFALIYPRTVFAIHGAGNALIGKVLGANRLSSAIVRLFPLFHPVHLKSGVLLLVAWLVLLGAVSVYLRKKAMDSLYPGLSRYEER